jgi:tetratricopeptide (TPR) repeat protein
MAMTNLTLEMVPMDVPTSDASARNAPAPEPAQAIEIGPVGKTSAPAAPVDKADPFLTEATCQYREGHLDQPLWDRAMAQENGNKEAAVPTYLRARATALRLLDRERRSGQRVDVAQATRAQLLEATNTKDFGEVAPPVLARPSALATNRSAVIAGVVLVALAVGGWLLYASQGSRSAEAAVARAAPAATPTKAVAPVVETATKLSAAPSPAGASPELMQRIQELRNAENWNVLVFYLVEWTRKEPANPTAWDQLRATYLTLHQSDDALGAAKKAVELSAEDPRMWRNLGAVYVDIDDPEKALHAFEQAVARDSADTESIKQVGILNAQLGRMAEAKVAFDQVLALAPVDAAALCMRTAVAQLSTAPKDAYATAKQAKVIGTTCRR